MEVISEWLENSYNNNKLSFLSCLFITGNSGIGKSYFINKIAKDLNLFTVSIDSYNCSNSLQLTDLLSKTFVTSLVQILTNNTQKKVIIIDDFDILMAIDNTINLALFNFIQTNSNKLKHIPIIIIINNELIKKIGEIKKKCKIFEMPQLSRDDFYKILITYNQELSLNETIKIIEETNYNLADAIKIVTKTNYNINDNLIFIEDLNGNHFDRNKFRQIILKEQWLIPLNFHENLITDLISNRKGLKCEKEKFYKNFIINFCYFDIYMYKNNEIGIEFFICSISGLFNFKLKKTNNKNNNFTKMLSYLSLQKKNNKVSYKSSFPFNQIGNYHAIIVNKKHNYG